MSHKRTASSNLNKDNWDEEEKPEEMGHYRTAPAYELKKRAMKKARRQVITGDREGGSVFKNFTAFGSVNSESATPNFSFLSGDGTAPKLTNTKSFASFSFSKVDESSKATTDNTADSTKVSSSEKPTVPTFSFSSQTTKSDNTATTTTPTFKFGIDTKTTSETTSSTLPSINFNFSKSGGSTTKQTGDSTFKFGINPSSDVKTSSTSNISTSQFPQKSKDREEIKSVPTLFSNFNSECSEDKDSKDSKVNGIKNASECESGKSNLFLANLKALNFGVLNWVKQHLDKNHYINLSPIFEDYKIHFQEIKDKYDTSDKSKVIDDKHKKSTSKSDNGDKKSESQVNSSTVNPLFSFGSSNTKVSNSEPFIFGSQSPANSSCKTNENGKSSDLKGFTFGKSNENADKKDDSNSNKSSTSSFTFGKDKTEPSFSFNASSNKPFTFGSSENAKTSEFSFASSNETKSGFTFQKTDNPVSTTVGFSFKPSQPLETNKTEDAEEDEVPKVEVNEVKEDDAVYEKKVKLFYKKEEKYVEKGVGTLFLKPAGEKTQLLIRAMTNLGNILLNIILNESIPTQRIGKNNVFLMCIPNPPFDPKSPDEPVSLLIRVKAESDADELLEKLNEHKK